MRVSPALNPAVEVVNAGAEEEVLIRTWDEPTALPVDSSLAWAEIRDVESVSLTVVILADSSGEGLSKTPKKHNIKKP